MTYLLEIVRFIMTDSFSMFSLLSLSYCLFLPLSAVLNLFGIHFICSLPIVDIYMLRSMVTDQNSFKISNLHLVINLPSFSSKIVVKIPP
jgi:hypothetical protein